MKDHFKREGFHDGIKFEFVAVDPLHYIDFRTAQPAGENGIVQFLTPDLYLVFQELKNPKGMFNIATYFLGPEKKGRFKQEYGVRYSAERIREAFKETNVFAFFSESEAAELKTLFETEHFTSAKVGVFSRRNGGNLLDLDAEEYKLVIDYFRTRNILRVVPGHNREDFSDEYIREEGFQAGYAKAKSEIPYFGSKQNIVTKKQIQRAGASAAVLFALSAVSQKVGKMLMGRDMFRTFVGMGLYSLGALGHMLAFKIGDSVITKFNGDVIFG